MEKGELVRLINRLADPEGALRREVVIRGPVLSVHGRTYITEKPLVISLGKCAEKMAKWAMENLKPVEVLSNGEVEGSIPLGNSHPLSDQESIRGAREIKRALSELDYDMVLFLVSGGASAMIEDPTVPLEDYNTTVKLLMDSGADIYALNTVRKHLSTVKGGRMALMAKSKVLNLLVSDVPEDDVYTIGSGPGLPDPTTYSDALEIVRYIESVPKSVVQYLRAGVRGEVPETPKELPNVAGTHVILSPLTVTRELSGYFTNPLVLTPWATGEASSLGEIIADIGLSVKKAGAPGKAPQTIILAGEPYVRVKGTGVGGRNSEVALSVASKLRETNYTFLAYATDGIDGNSRYAGVYFRDLYLDWREREKYRRESDTYTPFVKRGLHIETGRTGNNVNNIYVLEIE